MNNFLQTSIEKLPSTSFITLRKLKKIGINNFWDLLNYFPFRHENYSLISKINKLQEGEIVTIIGEIIEIKNEFTKKGLKIQKAKINDQTGEITLVWYNQPYLLHLLKPKIKISVSGEVKKYGRGLIIEPKEFEIFKDYQSLKHTGRIIPIYPEKKNISSKTLREKIFYLLKNLPPEENLEFLPSEILNYNQLIDEKSAYQNIHFPLDKNLKKLAKYRLAFDELFIIQLSANLIKKQWEKEVVGNQFQFNDQIVNKLNEFIKNLPFTLTKAQVKVWREIFHDLIQKKPMNRLLQGDVGSGKTVISALASYFAFLNGYQTLFMAPTEILAFQHYETLKALFLKTNVKIGIETGSKKISRQKKLIDNFDIIIGTHALINEKINFKKVGLVIIDEQHRFGVRQRAMVKEKGINPHLLTMTATPIPRTIALTLYEELDLSIIDELPKGRLPVKTYLVPNEKRERGYQWIKEKIKKNSDQVFIICPLIEESNVETMKTVKAVKNEYERLKKIFDEFQLALLHGKMTPKEKDKVLNDFKNKRYDILVSTPVVEVGIDIPNATIMIIEGAERFGLAQLHQLRGRVGRGDKQSYCFLFTEKQNLEIKERLEFFAKNNNGLTLAEYDLQHRGPGEIYGVKQHGIINLKIASFTDYQLIEKTKKAVHYFLNHYQIDQFPKLKEKIEEYNIKQITRD